MERLLLATAVLSDKATLTGPSGAGDMVLTNLQKQSLQTPYRVLNNVLMITVDLGAPSPINCIALIGHNMDAAATVQVTTPGYDSGIVPAISGTQGFAKSLFFLYLPGGVTGQVWTITIAAPNNTFVEIGRLYIAYAFQPQYNMTWGMQQGFEDPSQHNDTTSCDTITLERKKRRYADFTMQDLSEGEIFGGLYPLDSYVGLAKDVLFVPQPGQQTNLQFNAIYGKIDQMQPNTWTTYDRFSRQYRIRELLP